VCIRRNPALREDHPLATTGEAQVYRSCVEDNFKEPLGIDDLGTLQVSNDTASNTHDVIRVRTEVVVPRSRSSPYFVVLQQIRINEHTKLGCMTKGRNAAVGFGTLRQ
jgi:hypothetical protein